MQFETYNYLSQEKLIIIERYKVGIIDNCSMKILLLHVEESVHAVVRNSELKRVILILV
jgi:hypothetical protein